MTDALPPLNHGLLDALVGAAGEAVGVEELLRNLSLEKSDLHRDLDALRAAGYVIGKSHPYGSTAYQLLEIPDRLTPWEVQRERTTRWLGARLHCVPECTSTNDVARDLVREGAPHGTVVLAERQTAGRGRGGNRWFSPEGGGIYLSAILRPGADAPAPAVLQIASGVAVARAIMMRTARPVRLKWPNDVLMNDRKVAGILAEATNAGTPEAACVVGIGLNVARKREEFPPELRATATSIAAETGAPERRLRHLPTLLASLEEWYDRATAGDVAAIEAAWRPISMLLGRRVTLLHGAAERTGVVADLSLTTGLRLRLDDGREIDVPAEHAREVRLADVTKK